MATTKGTAPKVAYIFKESSPAGNGTWHPIVGLASSTVDYSWTGKHTFNDDTTFNDVVNAKAGINNFLNPTDRDAAITSPVTGIVCFLQQDAVGNTINQVQYYANGSWKIAGDSAALLSKTSDYTLVLGDAGKTIDVSSSSSVTITVPPNGSVAFSVGQKIEILRSGSGAVSVAAGSGVTINSKNGNLKIAAQYSGAVLVKRDTNTWTLIGDLTA